MPKSTNVTSFFGRKKRINGSSTDDLKGVTATLIDTTQTVNQNGHQNSNPGIPAAIKDLQHINGPTSQNRKNDFTKIICSHTLPNNFACNDKVQKNNAVFSASKGPKSDSVPLHISTLPDRVKKNEQLDGTGLQGKSQSANAVYIARKDPNYLMEALETLAAEQPVVARSIPRHAVVDTSDFAEHSLDNCLFDASVYDSMLNNSLKTCQLLQDHLNECVAHVRIGSPDEAEVSAGSGHAVYGTGEVESLDSEENASQQTVIMYPGRDSKRLSQLTTGSSITSTDSPIFVPNTSLTTQLKSTVQYQC